MISDFIGLMDITNKVLCWSCRKRIDVDKEYYEINLNRSLGAGASSRLECAKAGKDPCGHGAILRFHIACFEDSAGEAFSFDRKIFK